MRKIIFITVCLFLFNTVNTLKAQIGINTEDPDATLDVHAIVDSAVVPDGFIPPIMSGNQLKGKDNAYTTRQTGAIVYVTEPVTATSAKTTNVTSSGYYYFDGTVWQALKGEAGGGTSPWNVAGTTDRASQNTQNIYQMGNVGIGTQNPNASAALEVASTDKGFLPPRVNLDSITDVTTIPYPAEGLLVYSQSFNQTENGVIRTFPEGVYMFDGTKWMKMIASNDNNSGMPVRNQTCVLIQVNQSGAVTLNGYQSFGLLLQNAHATLSPAYDFGNWSPSTQSPADVISTTLGEDGAMLMEQKPSGTLTYWRLSFEYTLGNSPPAATRYFTVDIVNDINGGTVYSEAIVIPGGLNTGHHAPFSMFFATISDPANTHRGYKIKFGVDTAASNGLPNNISVKLKQILKID